MQVISPEVMSGDRHFPRVASPSPPSHARHRNLSGDLGSHQSSVSRFNAKSHWVSGGSFAIPVARDLDIV